MSEIAMLAAAELAAALEAENDALRAMDIRRAVAQFPRKSECLERFRQALKTADAPARAEAAASARGWAERLQALADDNRILLERAMFVQGRVIGILARAAPSQSVGYGRPVGRPAPAMTLSARA